MSSLRGLRVVCMLGVLVLGACRDKPKAKATSGSASAVAGMAAVPASAQVVLSVDVPSLIDAPLVERAVGQLLARDSELTTRWQAMRDGCRIKLGDQVKNVIIAVGAP